MKIVMEPYQQSLEQAFKKYYLPLRAYAFRYLNDLDEADDVVQEVFVELVPKFSSLRLNDIRLKSYLFQSVYHRSLNHLNSVEKRRTVSISEYETREVDDWLLPSLKEQSQESVLMADDLSKAIRRCVDGFPPQCRKVFVLSRTYRLRNQDIARQLNISVKAVEKHLSKALSLLRTYLSEGGFYLWLFLINIL